MTTSTNGIATKDVVDSTDLGKEMWSYLTGKAPRSTTGSST